MHSPLTTERKLALTIAGIVTTAIVIYLVSLTFVTKGPAPIDGGEILRAVRRFSAAHQPCPATVTFSQLIAQGYLGTNALQRFGAAEVTVYLNADARVFQALMMDAVMPDGSHLTVMTDGTVQKSSEKRVEQPALPESGSTPGFGASNNPAHDRPR